VHEIALVAADTAESLVLGPLSRRAVRSDAGAGRRMLDLLTESRVAELVLGGKNIEDLPTSTHSAPPMHVDLRDEARAEARRLQQHRTSNTTMGQVPPSRRISASLPIASLRRSCLEPGAVVIVDLAVRDGQGRVLHSEVVPIHASFNLKEDPHTAGVLRAHARRLLDTVARAAAPVLDAQASKRIAEVRPVHEAAISRQRQRENELAQAPPSAAQQLVQAGLFDRRAVRAAADREQVAVALHEDTHRQVKSLSSAMGLTVSTDQRAILFIRRR
jgi:hypothetical protein